MASSICKGEDEEDDTLIRVVLRLYSPSVPSHK